MNRLIRFLAVIAIALSPIWGFNGQAEARNAAYPVWPSFLSTGCQIISGPTGSTTISCGVGDFLLTQVNSGYACNQLDISVSNFFSGPFTATATVNSGSQSNTVSIDSSGNYYMQFPGFLVNNLITLQIAAPDSGTMTISSIQTSTCPVPTSTPTVNPSSTSTNTPVPVTGTPTAIPTFTPLPSGHSTFTPTITRTPTVTPVPTSTPLPAEVRCDDGTFPLLNCTFLNTISDPYPRPDHWVSGWDPGITAVGCYPAGTNGHPAQLVYTNPGEGAGQAPVCYQSVIAGATGNLFLEYQASEYGPNFGNMDWYANGNFRTMDVSSCGVGAANFCFVDLSGPYTAGQTVTFGPSEQNTGDVEVGIVLKLIWIGSSVSTPTPGPTNSPTSTPTGGTGPTATVTSTPTNTPIPIPGAMSTNIPTATECPGGCVVTQLTAIPGMATRVTVDTSPFSPFTSLSLARSSCSPFGYVAIPYPVVHGTPAYGSTTPLSVTWTIPITAPWDDTHPFSNTAIQPCAMLKEIPSTVWDFTYWFSVFAIAVVFIMWLIGFVGRLSGEETING